MRRRHILILRWAVLITPLRAAAESRSGKTWRIDFFGGSPSCDEVTYDTGQELTIRNHLGSRAGAGYPV
jgi:hypothetical protein